MLLLGWGAWEGIRRSHRSPSRPGTETVTAVCGVTQAQHWAWGSSEGNTECPGWVEAGWDWESAGAVALCGRRRVGKEWLRSGGGGAGASHDRHVFCHLWAEIIDFLEDKLT